MRGASVRFAIFAGGILMLLGSPDPAFSHGGGLDSNGGHHCRQAGYDSGKCSPLNSYHCHRSPCGESQTTSPPTTDPPTTEPPPTSPPVTQAPITTSPPTTSAPVARVGTTTSTTEADTTPPDPPTAEVNEPEADSPEFVATIEGEPGSSYEATVESRKQTKRGTIGPSGKERVSFLVENGDHTLTVVLSDEAGNESEALEVEFAVAIPRPNAPTVEITSGEGASPVVVRVTDAPPEGRTLITVNGDEQTIDHDEDGDGEAVFDLEPGDYTIRVVSEDFQGQRSNPVQLATTVDEEDDTLGAILGGIIVVGLIVGAIGLIRWRRQRSRAASSAGSVPVGSAAGPEDPPPPSAEG